MKESIHPQYEATTVTCACGEVIHTRSTKQNIRVEICSKCHPFFTGKQKLIDSAGRVEKFQKRYAKAAALQAKKEAGQNGAETQTEATTDEPAKKRLDDLAVQQTPQPDTASLPEETKA